MFIYHFRGTAKLARSLPRIDAQRGIRKPAGFAAALSIRTVYRPEGALRPYEDGLGPDGHFRYKWRGDDGDHAENRALRAAMHHQVPLIWFLGVGPGLYQPVFPVFILAEEPELQQFSSGVGPRRRPRSRTPRR